MVPYEELHRLWDLDTLKRLFEVMTIAGVIGIGLGIAFDNGRVISASVASTGTDAVGQLILDLFRC